MFANKASYFNPAFNPKNSIKPAPLFKLLNHFAESSGINAEVVPSKYYANCRLLKLAISERNLTEISAILTKYPNLLNASLTKKGETALMLAINRQSKKVIFTLLTMAPDLSIKDKKGLTAIDYVNLKAKYDYNNSTINPALSLQLQHRINAVKTIFEGLDQLKTQTLQIHQQSQIDNPIKDKLLNLVIKQINNIQLEKNHPDRLLDLYLLLKTILQICESNDIENNIAKLIKTREILLSGDAHDYCFNITLANHTAYQLAEILSHHVNPVNVLLSQSLNHRTKAWSNFLTLEEDLPNSPGEYFRDANNHIHLYEGIVERAIANLKLGYTALDRIWYGNDPDSYQQTLSTSELNILKQRTPTLACLVKYTEQLAAPLDTKNHDRLYERLSELREGLLKGDTDHKGSESNAAAPAMVAVAEFADWWNSLSQTLRGKGIKEQIRSVADGELGKTIERILNPSYGKNRLDYCVQIKGGELEDILKNKVYREQIRRISPLIKFEEASERKLNYWLGEIKLELVKYRSPNITTEKNIFLKLCSDQTSLAFLLENKQINYDYILSYGDQLIQSSKTTLRFILLDAIRGKSFEISKDLLNRHSNLLITKQEVKDVIYFLKQDPQVDAKLIKNINRQQTDDSKMSLFKLAGLTYPLAAMSLTGRAANSGSMSFFKRQQDDRKIKKYRNKYPQLTHDEFAFWSRLNMETKILFATWFLQSGQLVKNGIVTAGLIVKITAYLLGRDDVSSQNLLTTVGRRMQESILLNRLATAKKDASFTNKLSINKTIKLFKQTKSEDKVSALLIDKASGYLSTDEVDRQQQRLMYLTRFAQK